MSLVLAADYRVPDFDHWWATIASDLARLPGLGVHIVVVYRSLQDANRVFVTIGVKERGPVDALLRSPIMFSWFDSAGVEELPPMFVGQIVEKLNLDPDTLQARPAATGTRSPGAVMVGARHFLIAYNVNLATPEVEIATEIAHKIRESSGGFRFVKAMGLHLASVNRAQVSMNLTNFEEIPLDDLYRTIEQEAAKRGTSIAESELIGFVPRAAFDKSPEFFRRTWAFEEARIIENRIFRR